MSSRFATRLLVALAVAMSFWTGAVVSARMAWLQPLAVVTIQNRSGQPLRSLELEFESASARGVALVILRY